MIHIVPRKNGYIRFMQLLIHWGNENALNGASIPFFVQVVYFGKRESRCLFSNYKGD